MNRTLNEGRNPNQGRPIGLLIAWVFKFVETSDQREHLALGRDRAAMSRDARREARAWAKQQPTLAPLFDLERPKRPGEDSELEDIPF